MTEGKRSNDDGIYKDGVVIQRVIHEVGGGSSYPALTKTNYSDCVLLMKVKLKAWALWSVIENGGADQRDEMMATHCVARYHRRWCRRTRSQP
jgi:hypothetical protein